MTAEDRSQDNSSLKEWITTELVSGREEDQGRIEKLLSQHKDKAKDLFRLRDTGQVTIQKFDMATKLQIATYLLGAAYARVGELREDDGVLNKELVEQLGLPEGTMKSQLKRLRDDAWAVQKGAGVHRINYRKISEIIAAVTQSK